jgi:hypothetical protein
MATSLVLHPLLVALLCDVPLLTLKVMVNKSWAGFLVGVGGVCGYRFPLGDIYGNPGWLLQPCGGSLLVPVLWLVVF